MNCVYDFESCLDDECKLERGMYLWHGGVWVDRSLLRNVWNVLLDVDNQNDLFQMIVKLKEGETG